MKFFIYPKQNESVVVIDDNEVTLKMTSMMLEKFVTHTIRIHVTETSTIADILNEIKYAIDQGKIIKFILSDYQMPLPFDDLINAIHNEFPDLPIAAITSADQDETHEMIKESLILVLPRPFSVTSWDELSDALNKFYGKTKTLYQNSNRHGGVLHNLI